MNLPDFHYADYELAPAFGCHARIGEATHPMLVEHLLLHVPLAQTASETAAKGSSRNRVCVFWQEWIQSPLEHVSYAFPKEGDDTYLLVFVQPKPGHDQPLRLIVCLVDENFPKVGRLWPMINHYLKKLPALQVSNQSSKSVPING